MKIWPLIVLPCYFLVQTCVTSRPIDEQDKTKSKEIPPASPMAKIDFEKQVLPVLVQNCSPCHFTGGKMYERLPFDKDTTILNNAGKILKRVYKDEKKAIVRDYILENRPEAAAAIK